MFNAMLQPALALVIWTQLMAVLLLVTRVPMTIKLKVNFEKIKNGAQLRGVLPEKINWISDNYNHLHEQPVLFYALCFILTAGSLDNALNAKMAWAYVALRISHSLWQSFVNFVPVRFLIFVLSNVTLVILSLRAASSLF